VITLMVVVEDSGLMRLHAESTDNNRDVMYSYIGALQAAQRVVLDAVFQKSYEVKNGQEFAGPMPEALRRTWEETISRLRSEGAQG
jgi:hypothetical protein